MLRQNGEYGAHKARIRQTLCAIYIVGGGEFTRGFLTKINGATLPSGFVFREMPIFPHHFATCVFFHHKRGVGRKLNPRSNLNVVLRFGNQLWRSILWQHLPLFVKVGRVHDSFGRSRNNFVGALQIVVLIERLINRRDVSGLVRDIGALWVEGFG